MKSLTAVAIMIALAAPVFADEGGVFLSLTRTAENIENLPTNVSIITSGMIEQKHAANLGDALQSELGINVSQTGTQGAESNVSIRGSSPQQVLILIDGRRINDIALGLTDLSTIPAGNISRIEIIRGAASAIYGANAFGGVINVITKQGNDSMPAATIGAQGGSFGEQIYRGSLNLKKDNVSGVLNLEQSHLDGWRQNSDYDSDNASMRLGMKTEQCGNFDFSGQILNRELGVPGPNYTNTQNANTYTDPAAASSINERQKDNNQYARLENTINLDGHSFITSIYASDNVRDISKSNPLDLPNNRYNNIIFGGEERYSGPLNITAGLEWWEEQFKQTDLDNSQVTVDRSRVNSDVYLQQQIALNNFTFIPGVRLDSNSSFGSVASPRISIVYKLDDAIKISGNTGRAWRSPTFDDLYFPMDAYGDVGNPDIKPEEGISSDLGLEIKSSKASASITGFITDNRNLIIWAPNSAGAFTPQNIDSSRSSGMEVSLKQTIAAGLAHALSYTYLWAENTDTMQVLLYSPCNTIDYQINYLLPCGTHLDLSAKYVSQQMGQNAATYAMQTLNDYTVLGAQLSHNFKNFDMWIKGANLTNQKYVVRENYPLSGATLEAGVTYKIWN